MLAFYHILIAVSVLFTTTNATNYFISSYGSDSNVGTSMTASWRSMSRVYQAMTSTIRSGDFIYFCKNERWTYSMIDATVAGVNYGAYDCVNQRLIDQSTILPINQRPQITPAIDLDYRRWRISSINRSINPSVPTLQYDYSDDSLIFDNGLAALWVNNVRYHLARYPNLIDPVNQVTWGQTGEFSQMNNITDRVMLYTAVNQPSYQKSNDFWTGVRMHFRQANWIYFESFAVSSTVTNLGDDRSLNRVVLDRTWGSQGTLQFHFEAHPNGRYAQHKELLDQVGEFVLDRSTNTLYLIPMDLNTANRILDGSFPVSGLYGNGGCAALIRARNISISNIEFTKANGGIIVQQGLLTVKSTSITHMLSNGYFSNNVQNNMTIVDSYMDDIEATCLTVVGIQSLVERNSINRCGLYARTATTNTNPTWNGVTITSGIVRFNQIRGCGYACVAPHAGATVDSNYIENAMMTLNDGGAIYSYGSFDNYAKVVNNVINGVVGNYVSWAPNRIAPCMYMDEGTVGALMQNNSCIGAAHCVYLNQAFSHSILMNDCQCPGLYASKGSGHLFAGNLVVSTGTNGYWQNPIVRATSTSQNYNGIMTMFDQAYCIKGDGYMFQRQTVDGTWRYDDFNGWKAAELTANPQWERGSRGVTACDGWKPINYTAADPWAFLRSSSTGAAVIQSSSSSSVVRPSSTASESVSSSSSSSMVMSSSSSASAGHEACGFNGPFKQPSTKITLKLRIPSFVAATLDLLFKDLDRWFELRGYVDLAWRVNLECGSFGPVGVTSRRRLLASDMYELTFYVVDYEHAADATNVLVEAINGPGWSGELSASEAISQPMIGSQQCEDGSNVSLYEECPVAQPEDEVSTSSSSTGVIGAAIGGVIGGLVVFTLLGLAIRSYRNRSMDSTAVSARASPVSSPVFNVLKGSPSSSPRLDPGLAMTSHNQSTVQSDDPSSLTPRFELSTSQAPFLQMPPSPMSAGYSPSASHVAYNMMPPSPQMLHPATTQKAPVVEYYRMPAQPLQLPKGRPISFSKPLPDPNAAANANRPSPNQPMTARVHEPIKPANSGFLSARAPPALPANKPTINQSNNRTPSQSPPSTSRPALPVKI